MTRIAAISALVLETTRGSIAASSEIEVDADTFREFRHGTTRRPGFRIIGHKAGYDSFHRIWMRIFMRDTLQLVLIVYFESIFCG